MAVGDLLIGSFSSPVGTFLPSRSKRKGWDSQPFPNRLSFQDPPLGRTPDRSGTVRLRVPTLFRLSCPGGPSSSVLSWGRTIHLRLLRLTFSFSLFTSVQGPSRRWVSTSLLVGLLQRYDPTSLLEVRPPTPTVSTHQGTQVDLEVCRPRTRTHNRTTTRA